ncbi:MAG: sigma 54-interacting transcriptional regulator [Ignavibacteriaceae bacterium]
MDIQNATMEDPSNNFVEEKVTQNEGEFKQIVEAIPALIIVMSPDGRYLYANKKVLEYTGYTQEDVVAGNFRDRVFHPDDVEHLKQDRMEALRRGLPFEMEQRVLRKDGQYRWFLTRLNPQVDELGKLVRWYATGIDIDDRKHEEERVKKENTALREEIDKNSDLKIVGSGEVMKKVFHLMKLVSFTNSSVLILGETGTGKELIARSIHNNSTRKDKVMVKVNCAVLPAGLIESVLFGHEKGSFTGANERRTGKFELANNSTLFLDEIGEMPLELQVKLLRAIQEKEIERLGGKETINVDVRIIAATNRDLFKEVEEGNFRSDLYYRLNVFPITIPPLRERKDDIPELAQYFLNHSAKYIGKKITGFSPGVTKSLINYSWPGNVRELEHLIERSVILTNGTTIEEIHLPAIGSTNKTLVHENIRFKTIEENERDYILEVLRKCNGKVSGTSGAAALLGIPVSTLNSKIKKLGITKERNFYKDKPLYNLL